MPDITVEVTQSDITANVTSPNITANVTSADVAANVTTAEVTANVEAANVTVNITGGGSPHIIQDEGVAETQRANLNFVGAGVSVSDDSANNATVVTISGGGGGGGTWGSITGTLSDQTDLQAALDAKAASSHTHALSDITQSGATTNQVPKWNGSAWVPANEAGGADGNGIYSGSGTIPGATEALLEPNGSFDIHFDGGIGAFVISDGTGSTAIQNKAGTATIAADSTGVIIVADDMLSIEAEGSTGTLNQVLTRGANGAIWQDATGGGASVTQITYAATQTAITNGTLTPGGWYLITDAAGTDLGFLTNAVNENTINVQGVGGYLNADFQAVGDYSNTPETFGAQLGRWRTGFEVVTINYLNLAGGTFAVGDTITGDSTAATAVIVTDDGAASMTAYMTSAGVAFDGSEVLDNGNGVTADQDGAASSPTIVQGDVVIWNLTHYQLTDATLLDGTDPATNTAAYTLLDKATANVGYITAWDVSEFDFPNNWIQYRVDAQNNRIRYTQSFDANGEDYGFSIIPFFQWGNQYWKDNYSDNGLIYQPNSVCRIYSNIFNTYTGVYNNNFSGDCSIYENRDAVISGNIAVSGCNINRNVFLGQSYITGCNLASGASVGDNTTIGSATISVTLGENSVCQNNILENGASLTGITAGESCSIRGNTVGQGATLGGGTTMGDGALMNDNVLGPSASISNSTLSDGAAIETNNLLGGAQIDNNTLNESALISGNNIGSDASIMGNTLMDSGRISGNILLGADAAISNNTVQADGQIANCTVTPGVDLANKTVQTGIYLSESYFSLSANETEDISDNIEGNRTQSGFSDIPGTIDITGLTTLDCTAAWAQYRGIYNITSSNATEAIDTITNPPTAFPFILKNAGTGLAITVTGTAYAGIAAGQIALKAASYVLNPGEYIVLDYDAATGALIENRVVNALI